MKLIAVLLIMVLSLISSLKLNQSNKSHNLHAEKQTEQEVDAITKDIDTKTPYHKPQLCDKAGLIYPNEKPTPLVVPSSQRLGHKVKYPTEQLLESKSNKPETGGKNDAKPVEVKKPTGEKSKPKEGKKPEDTDMKINQLNRNQEVKNQ